MKIPELETSVFLVATGFSGRIRLGGVKNSDEWLIVLNSVAKKVIESQRGKNSKYVFIYEGHVVGHMFNNGWKNARERAAKIDATEMGTPENLGFRKLRVHDLKHTYGHRLHVAGIPKEDRKNLLGHKSNRSVTTDYSALALERLLEYSERVLKTNHR